MDYITCKKFADVAVKIGVNLQKGQDAIIFISPRHYELADVIAQTCYENGARRVNIEYIDEDLMKLKYKHESLKTLKDISEWEILKFKQRSEDLPCLIHVIDDDPDAFKGLNLKKINEARIAKAKKLKFIEIKKVYIINGQLLHYHLLHGQKKSFQNVKMLKKNCYLQSCIQLD